MSLIECTKNHHCPELDAELRKKLYGSSATKRDFINEIIRLSIGDARRHQEPLNSTQIEKRLGIGKDLRIELIKLGSDHGLCKRSDTGRLDLPEETQQAQAFAHYDKDAFMQDPYVKSWIEHLQAKGKKSWHTNYNDLKNFCNTYHRRPEQLLPPIIRNHQQLAAQLEKDKLALLRGDVSFVKSNLGLKNAMTQDDKDNLFHRLVQTIRIFVQFNGLSIPKNIGGILSGKVRHHGEYADVRLSEDEIKIGEEYIINKWGLDSDIFRIYSIGIDSGARATALLNIECSWEETRHPKTQQLIFVMKAYESKTNSWWKKYISNPRAQESLRLHRAKNKFAKIISSNSQQYTQSRIYLELCEQLREVYTYLGKDKMHQDKKGVGYFMKKPFHTLRHVSAQHYILLTKNYTAVTFFCGWKSEIELRASYGEMPAELLFETLGVGALT